LINIVNSDILKLIRRTYPFLYRNSAIPTGMTSKNLLCRWLPAIWYFVPELGNRKLPNKKIK